MSETAEPEAGEVKPPRSTLVTFTQSTLLFESMVIGFATLAAWSLGRASQGSLHPAAIWAGGMALASLMALASWKATERWGRAFGWALHVPFIAAGLVVPAVAVLGVVFLAIYALGVRWGARIDRERAARDAERSEA